MAVYKNKSNNTWYVSVYYKNWQGSTDRKVKRGFKTKREASEWERTFLLQRSDDVDMTFGAFWELYKADLKEKIRENTWNTKISVIEKKVLPYFQNKKLCEIKPTDIMSWQNEMMGYRDSAGKPYSKTYLKTIHNQISAIFNHAVKFYDLKSNPVAKVGNMGKEQTKEMQFWTKPEYLKFAEAIMDKPISYYAFEILYWCGLRLGELLALTSADLDFEKQTVTINKSFQHLNGRDIITSPKTEKSNRTIKLPNFLCDEIQDYLKMLYDVGLDDRMFPVTKSYLYREMERGSKQAGIKRIRIHDIRHSHVSLLIDMGFSATAIADRVGHESIDITYNYAHLFPSKQTEMAGKLDMERGK